MLGGFGGGGFGGGGFEGGGVGGGGFAAAWANWANRAFCSATVIYSHARLFLSQVQHDGLFPLHFRFRPDMKDY